MREPNQPASQPGERKEESENGNMHLSEPKPSLARPRDPHQDTRIELISLVHPKTQNLSGLLPRPPLAAAPTLVQLLRPSAQFRPALACMHAAPHFVWSIALALPCPDYCVRSNAPTLDGARSSGEPNPLAYQRHITTTCPPTTSHPIGVVLGVGEGTAGVLGAAGSRQRGPVEGGRVSVFPSPTPNHGPRSMRLSRTKMKPSIRCHHPPPTMEPTQTRTRTEGPDNGDPPPRNGG